MQREGSEFPCLGKSGSMNFTCSERPGRHHGPAGSAPCSQGRSAGNSGTPHLKGSHDGTEDISLWMEKRDSPAQRLHVSVLHGHKPRQKSEESQGVKNSLFFSSQSDKTKAGGGTRGFNEREIYSWQSSARCSTFLAGATECSGRKADVAAVESSARRPIDLMDGRAQQAADGEDGSSGIGRLALTGIVVHVCGTCRS